MLLFFIIINLKKKLLVEILWRKGFKKLCWGEFLNKFMLRSQIIKYVFDFMPQTMSKENKILLWRSA